MVGGLDQDGYRVFTLCKEGKRKTAKLHRLVAEAFNRKPNGTTQINHIDGNKENNRADNLEWVTVGENIQHSFKLGLNKYKPLNWEVCSKPVLQHLTTGEFINRYPSLSEATRVTSIPVARISACCNGKSKTAGGYVWKFER